MLSATRSQKQAIQDTNKIQPGKSASTTLRQTRKRTAEEKRVQSSPTERETENKLSVQEILDRCKESDHGRVFEINLNGQALKQVPNLKEFQKLKILDLGCNKLKELSPNDLEKNCDLRELKLYANEITEISGLDRCKELNNLLLQHNKIKLIGKGLQNVRKLKVLRLDNNRLSKIDYREIGCCSQLTVLDISCNDIHDISALNALPTLEELDLSNNKISRIPDMGRCKKIQELDISRNHISNLAGLRAISTLTVLRAENNDITSLDSIGKLRCLQELYLAGNRISEVKSFPNQFSALEILDLSNNIIENIEEMFVLSGISTLVELSVKGNPFKSEDGYSCHRQISQRIPSLEFLDKVSLKRPNTGHSHAPPPMRPMSASQVLSSRQVEEQIKATLLEQESFEASISSRLKSMELWNSDLATLAEAVEPREMTVVRSTAIRSIRFNIVRDLFKSLPMELRINQSDERSLSKISVFDVESVSASRPSSAGEESRPKSRCSSRSRIAEARAFAAEHFRTQEADTNSTS